MSKKNVYIETSFISYLTSRPSRNIIMAGHQAITHDWWEDCRYRFNLFISELVIMEAQRGDEVAAQQRLNALEGLPLLDLSVQAEHFAELLLLHHAVPQKAAEDAAHIAVCCVAGVDYLLTWNCKHIANAQCYRAIEELCIAQGYIPPVICTPAELLGDIPNEMA
ncbi:MAG: type II toxin-antitoxin system VapC family toxin [Cellvibrionaceae bacterium]|nr:type II toxin-antitoxin system VapC family toxin [Cellvibrionaceae bacterium]